MDLTRQRELWEGWRLTPAVVGVYAAASLVGALISLDPGNGRAVRVAAAAVVATLVAVGAVVGSAAVARRLHAVQVTGPRLLLAAPVIGALRGVVLVVVADLLDLVPLAGLPGIMLSSALSALVWLGLGGLLVASRDAYRRRYRSMLLRGARRGSPSLSDDTFDWEAQPEIRRLRAALSAASVAGREDPTVDELARASAVIRWEIETTLRPLSHRLWFGALGQEPRVRWSGVLRDAVAGLTVPTRWVTVLWLVGGVVGGTALLGLGEGIVAAVLSSVILAGSLTAGARLMRGRSTLLGGSIVIVVTGALTILGTDRIMAALGFTTSLAWDNGLAIGLWLAVVGMVLAASAIALADADRRLVLDVATLQAAQASAYLHNSLQAELTGLAMQLDAAAIDPDPCAAREAVERLHALVTRSLADDAASVQFDPSARARTVADAWAGICDVTFRIDDSASADPRLMVAVQAAEELIANAVRHSGASVIRVDVCVGSVSLTVDCWADARGAPASGTGLGSQLLSSAAPAGVVAREVDAGTAYRLEIH